jgi:preprotein translocase subunit YajC
MALLIPLFILAAFFLLRANPQRRRAQQQRTLVDSLRPGTKVVTVAGIVGTLVGVEGDRAAVELAPGVIVEFLVAAIVRVDADIAAVPEVDLTHGHDEPGHDEPGHDELGHDELGHDDPDHQRPDHDEHVGDALAMDVPEPERAPGHAEEA